MQAFDQLTAGEVAALEVGPGEDDWRARHDTNGTIDARISANGKLTWKARGDSAAPWWSAKTKKKIGSCVGR